MTWMSAQKALLKFPEMLLSSRFTFTFDGIPLRAEHLSWRRKLNLMKIGISSMRRLDIALGFPPIIQVEPTNICNLRCPLCPTGSGTSSRQKGFMTLDTFGRILDELEHTLIAVYLFSYGEPFMNTDLHHMIEACTKREILTLTTTNGHHIQKPQDALKVIDAGLTTLIYAVDGSSQEIYETYRKKGDIEKVKRSIALVEEAKTRRGVCHPFTVIRSVIMRHNLQDLPNLEQLAGELGVNMFAAKTVGCQPDSEQYSDFEPLRADMRRFKNGISDRRDRVFARCPFPFRQPTVFWDGTVVGSEHDNEMELPFGKIGEQPFSRIWNGPNAIRLRRSLRQGHDLPRFCRACPHSDQVRTGVEVIHKEVRPPH